MLELDYLLTFTELVHTCRKPNTYKLPLKSVPVCMDVYIVFQGKLVLSGICER